MNTQERKYRFTEIITAITLLPDELEEVPVLPNKTLGLSDGSLKSALVSQAFREGEEFSNKLTNALVGSAMTNIKDNDSPSEEDMSAIGLAMSLAWAHGELPYFLSLSGLVAMIYEKHHNDSTCDYLIPSEVITILGNSKNAKNFSKFEPYDLLENKVTPSDIMDEVSKSEIPDNIKAQILEAIQKELDNE